MSLYKKIISSSKKINITVVGDLMLDKYIWGTANRISPESPVPIVLVESETESLGGAGNVIANLHGLGVNTNIVSIIGSDHNGKRVLQLLKLLGCNVDGVIKSKSSQTISKIRVLAQKQQVVRIDYETIEKIDNDEYELINKTKRAMKNSRLVIISDYEKGTLTDKEISDIIKYANYLGIPVLVDPKRRDFKVFKNCACITPNLKELYHALPSFENSDEGIIRAGRTLKKKYNFENIIITRGKDGMSVLHNNNVFHLPTEAREVYDVSGAGDTVIATLAVCLSLGISYEDSTKIANTAAGIVVSHIGTVPISLSELEPLIK